MAVVVAEHTAMSYDSRTSERMCASTAVRIVYARFLLAVLVVSGDLLVLTSAKSRTTKTRRMHSGGNTIVGVRDAGYSVGGGTGAREDVLLPNDKDGDELLNRAEFATFLTKAIPSELLSWQNSEQSRQGTGSIRKRGEQTVHDLYARLFARMDTDKSGAVDLAELHYWADAMSKEFSGAMEASTTAGKMSDADYA
eukprot:SAG31_NODE_1921_length_6916_cov_6.643245_5_plen_196_part_00